MIGLEHSMCVEPCFINESHSAAVQDEVVQTGTPSTVEPCNADNSHATLLMIESHLGSSPVIGSAATPPDHKGNLTYISKYLIQYVPCKPYCSTCQILTIEE